MLQRKQERVMARAYGGAGRRSRPSRLSEGYLEEEQVGDGMHAVKDCTWTSVELMIIFMVPLP
jgi:hypothetical protein